jgi:hypothetical protein
MTIFEMGKGDSTDGIYLLARGPSDNKAALTINNQYMTIANSSGLFTLNAWVYFCVRRTGQLVELATDGTVRGTLTLSSAGGPAGGAAATDPGDQPGRDRRGNRRSDDGRTDVARQRGRLPHRGVRRPADRPGRSPGPQNGPWSFPPTHWARRPCDPSSLPFSVPCPAVQQFPKLCGRGPFPDRIHTWEHHFQIRFHTRWFCRSRDALPPFYWSLRNIGSASNTIQRISGKVWWLRRLFELLYPGTVVYWQKEQGVGVKKSTV